MKTQSRVTPATKPRVIKVTVTLISWPEITDHIGARIKVDDGTDQVFHIPDISRLRDASLPKNRLYDAAIALMEQDKADEERRLHDGGER